MVTAFLALDAPAEALEEMALRCSLVCAASTLGVGLGVGLRLRGGGRGRCSLVCGVDLGLDGPEHRVGARAQAVAVAMAMVLRVGRGAPG